MLENLEKYKIILASNSPRRKELLSGLGIKYEVKTLPGIEETYPDTLKAEEIPLYIACEKAAAYRNTYHASGRIDYYCRYHCMVGWCSHGQAS